MALSAILLLGICGCPKKQSQKVTDVKQSEKTEVVETPSVEEESEPEILEERIPPFDIYGPLAVEGSALVTADDGSYVQLRGMSTHGIAWYPKFVCEETFKYLRDSWNINCIRLAMYTAEHMGYCTDGNKEELKALVRKGVDIATELGLYVIIDWHILSDRNPLTNADEAVLFFDEMSKLYGDHGNVLYEICNEPNNTSWKDVKSYANRVIPVIRKNAPDSVVICGTPTWSQDIHIAQADPLDFKNVMYSLHFYAATHTNWLRDRMEECINADFPVFITEFGICDASGNGACDMFQAGEWKNIIEKYNVSYMCWNLANKNESSSIIKEFSSKLSNWTEKELSVQGKWISEWFKSE